MAAVLYLISFMLMGCAVTRCLFPRRQVLTRVWMGACLGVFLMMWLPYLSAFLFGFTLKAHVLALLAAVMITLGCAVSVRRTAAVRWGDEDRSLLVTMLFTVVPLFLFSMVLEWTHNIRPAADGLHVGQSTYGDLNLHLSIITSMRNASVPADYSIYPGARLSYPFLTDTLSTSCMLLGMDLRAAVLVPSGVMLLLLYSGYIILADRIFHRRRTAVLAFLFFFLNGGLGFLYAFDMIGVSLGSAGANQLQEGVGVLARLRNILYGWYQAPANHAEFTTYNLRWSNILCDMLIPQRTILGGWCQLLPCLYLTYDLADSGSGREDTAPGRFRNALFLGIWAGGLVMIHTHSFFALGLTSIGWTIWCAVRGKGRFLQRILPWAVYGGTALLLALPQLLVWTFGQVGGSDHFLSFHFNWVNNSGSAGLRDGYLWFYIKNIGLPFVLILLSLLEKNGKRRFLAAGAFTIFVTAELIQFQPNEYDNNKLFYVWYMFGAMLAADFAWEIWDRMKPLCSRFAAAALAGVICFSSAGLSFAREAVSDYMLFSKYDVEAAEFIEKETPQHAVFISWTQHINPVCALAGRDIVCGPDLWLYYHGLNTWERQMDIREFYRDPAGNRKMLEDYNVSYIFVGSYERANLTIDEDALDREFDRVFESSNGEIAIWRVNHDE